MARFGIVNSTTEISDTLNVNTTTVGNIGSGEDDLTTYLVPANTLAVDGDSITFEACGIFSASANNKQLRAYFGTDVIFDSGVLAITAATEWIMTGRIIRTGSATQRVYITLVTDNTTLFTMTNVLATTRTLSIDNPLKLTGEATNNDEVRQFSMIVSFNPI